MRLVIAGTVAAGVRYITIGMVARGMVGQKGQVRSLECTVGISNMFANSRLGTFKSDIF